MTRKHFTDIAAMLHMSKPVQGPRETDDRFAGRLDQWRADVAGIASACMRANPGFKPERFYDACGVGD